MQLEAGADVLAAEVAEQRLKRAIRAKRLGNDWRIHRDDLEAFMRIGPALPAKPRQRVA